MWGGREEGQKWMTRSKEGTWKGRDERKSSMSDSGSDKWWAAGLTSRWLSIEILLSVFFFLWMWETMTNFWMWRKGRADCLHVEKPCMLSRQHACVCTCVPQVVAKLEIGLLLTNRRPLISTSDFLLSLSAYQSSSVPLSPCSSSAFPSPPSHPRLPVLPLHLIFPPYIFLFSSGTFSIPHSIFSACPLSFFPELIISFFLLTHPRPDAHFSKFFRSFKKSLRVCPYSNTRCHSTAVQLCSDLLHN